MLARARQKLKMGLCEVFTFGGSTSYFMFHYLPLQSELPLVGNIAPDFEAEAVFDQEFIKVLFNGFGFGYIKSNGFLKSELK